MSNYEHPVYVNEVEAEMLMGLLCADESTEDGKQVHNQWAYIIEQLDRILNGGAVDYSADDIYAGQEDSDG